jgi:homospermidine synthase
MSRSQVFVLVGRNEVSPGMRDTKYLTFSKRIVMIGCGSIGEGTIPLLLRHIDMKPDQLTIITADDRGQSTAEEYGIKFLVEPLTKENYEKILTPMLEKGDFLINLSVDVSTNALIELCQRQGAFYIDTCIEPWLGEYTNLDLSVSERSNYILRDMALGLSAKYEKGPTAILAHGANPGLVSHFVKRAMMKMAEETGLKVQTPSSRLEWAKLAQKLGIKVIHIAERDTQVSQKPREPGEFVNTWSIDGFYSESSQPAELGWGTHEKAFPFDGGRHGFGCDAAIYLERPGYITRVRSWTPLEGPYQGFLVTHNESISIADYLTVPNGGTAPVYRPTVHYAYHPCDDAVISMHELSGKNGQLQARKRLMMDEIVKGTDELGVLLMGNEKGVYWFGSRLTIDEARRLIPHNNATSLQVTVSVLAGVIWALENPNRGIVEAEYMNFERVLEIASPYLGEVVGVWGDWSPLKDRSLLFNEDIDPSDPWQFKNIRVA